ncbi:MAG: hypothetical protein H6Q90_3063 [Deltaproteobacteria bacterium]|nr:hypothetical protein [Deltaproteobacteria bacterium]
MSDSNRNSSRVFSLVEEEFFRAGASRTESNAPQESFADLDEGYRPTSLWRRLFGRKPTQQ